MAISLDGRVIRIPVSFTCVPDISFSAVLFEKRLFLHFLPQTEREDGCYVSTQKWLYFSGMQAVPTEQRSLGMNRGIQIEVLNYSFHHLVRKIQASFLHISTLAWFSRGGGTFGRCYAIRATLTMIPLGHYYLTNRKTQPNKQTKTFPHRIKI